MNRDFAWLIPTLAFFFGMSLIILAFGEISEINPIKSQYTFGQVVTFGAVTDEEVVTAKIMTENGTMVDVLQLPGNGKFSGASLVHPNWKAGTYLIELDDGSDVKVIEFEVIRDTVIAPEPQMPEPSNDLAKENAKLRAEIVELKQEIKDLRQIIYEQIKVIYEWVISR